MSFDYLQSIYLPIHASTVPIQLYQLLPVPSQSKFLSHLLCSTPKNPAARISKHCRRESWSLDGIVQNREMAQQCHRLLGKYRKMMINCKILGRLSNSHWNSPCSFPVGERKSICIQIWYRYQKFFESISMQTMSKKDCQQKGSKLFMLTQVNEKNMTCTIHQTEQICKNAQEASQMSFAQAQAHEAYSWSHDVTATAVLTDDKL